jgi:hypothetical protein
MATRGFGHAAVGTAPLAEIQSPGFVNQTTAPRHIELDSVPNWIGDETACAGMTRHDTASQHRHRAGLGSGDTAYCRLAVNVISGRKTRNIRFTAGNDAITSSHTGTNSMTLLGVGSALMALSFYFA